MPYCVGCGRTTEECDGTCRRPLDPPRFCPTCGKRMTVQVTPQGYRAGCRKHGDLALMDYQTTAHPDYETPPEIAP